MKRFITLLLIASSVIMAANAQRRPQSQYTNSPKNVISTLNDIISIWGKKDSQTYSVNKNLNTGLIESSEQIVHFVADGNFNADHIGGAFMQDEPLSYQILHLTPGSTEYLRLKMVTASNSKDIRVRTKPQQEMWLLCTKNSSNPELRDAYAIVWEQKDNGQKEGDVFIITSLRPDIYAKELETSKNTFKIVGRVDAAITDSLYNVYMADSREALYALDDDDYVACVPVVNKRFEYQTELDHPMAGRIRCIFPDGSLCTDWIDLDFVPGETYNITVHNGYYDSDQDYERRVGRNSGKSLINPKRVAGIVVEDDVADTIPDDDAAGQSTEESSHFKPNPQQAMQLERIAGIIKFQQGSIKSSYEGLFGANELAKQLTLGVGHLELDKPLKEIVKQNKELDKRCLEAFKLLNSMNIPAIDWTTMYGGLSKEILKFYTEQQHGLMELQKKLGPSKAIVKTQRAINKLIEKHMKKVINLDYAPTK